MQCVLAGMSTTTRAVVPPRRQLSVKERSTVAEVDSEDSDDTESRQGQNGIRMLHIHRSLFTGTGATLSPTFSASGGRPCELLPPAITVASSTGGPSDAEGENHVEKQFRYAEHLRRQLEPTACDFFVGYGSGGGGSLRYRSRPAGQRDSVR